MQCPLHSSRLLLFLSYTRVASVPTVPQYECVCSMKAGGGVGGGVGGGGVGGGVGGGGVGGVGGGGVGGGVGAGGGVGVDGSGGIFAILDSLARTDTTCACACTTNASSWEAVVL